MYKNPKYNFEFSYTYLWQILKHFAGTFRQAQTQKLGGVLLLEMPAAEPDGAWMAQESSRHNVL